MRSVYRLQSLAYVCMFKVWHPDPRNLYGIHSVNYIGATYLPDICTCNGARIHIVCFKTCLAAVSCKGTKCHRMLCVVLACHCVETLYYTRTTLHTLLWHLAHFIFIRFPLNHWHQAVIIMTLCMQQYVWTGWKLYRIIDSVEFLGCVTWKY